MNTAETALATLILNAASQTARREDAGNTLLFVEAYEKLIVASFASYAASLKYEGEEELGKTVVKDCTVTGECTTGINIATKEAPLPDLGEPTPIQPIPAGRTRRTKAQIEADRFAAEQAAQQPVETLVQEPVTPPAAAPTPEPAAEPAADGDTPFTAIDLSNLFNTIRVSLDPTARAPYVKAVKDRLEQIGAKVVSAVDEKDIPAFRALLDSFKA